MFLVFRLEVVFIFRLNLKQFLAEPIRLWYSPVTFWNRCKEGSYEIQGLFKTEGYNFKAKFLP